MAALIQQQCNAAFERLNKLDAIHGELDDYSEQRAALNAAYEMQEEAWEVRTMVAEIRKMASSIEAWAADPDTD
jgi:hypothetical protein